MIMKLVSVCVTLESSRGCKVAAVGGGIENQRRVEQSKAVGDKQFAQGNMLLHPL
jgi:hypothetical protein